MSSTFIEHSPETEGDKSLILIMDEDGNVTTDQTHFEKVINNKQLPEMGIKIVRLSSSQNENDGVVGNDEKPELKLTVEEIYPDSLSLSANDTGNNMINSSLEMLPGTSNENMNHDIVDPFSQMDPEQLQRLEHALASEQAKQILGENVAAMLDMLSVDESPAAFLQNSIKNDHCYTNLLPSSDPNGPSFFVGDVRANTDIMRGKGKTKPPAPVKSRKVTTTVSSVGSPMKRQVIKEVPQQLMKQPQGKERITDFGQTKSQVPTDNTTFEEEVDIEDMDSETSAGVEDNPSDEDYNDRTKKGGKRKPRRNKKIIVKKPGVGRSPGRPAGKPGVRLNKRSRNFQEIHARNEKLNDEMAKVVQSMDYGPKSDEDKSESVKGIRKVRAEDSICEASPRESVAIRGVNENINFLKMFKKKKGKEEPIIEEPRVVIEPIPADVVSVKSQQAKYPKRENRKPPAHLAEAFGPALFSTPDIIRRISTGEELPQTPPSEKKNFTVGVMKATTVLGHQADGKVLTKSIETKTNKIKKAESVLKEPVNHVQVKPGPSENVKTVEQSLLKTVKVESLPKAKVMVEPIDDKTKIQIPVTSERAVIIKKSNTEIQKLIEKHQSSPVKSSVYEEEQDYSDENIEENYYLDPTQMDQSLLESFAQQNCKSEDQLLQEAILLQEQLIGSNKGTELEKSQGIINFDETFTENIPDGFAPETMDSIQNEIASAMIIDTKERGQTSRAGRAGKRSSTDDGKRSFRMGESQSEADESMRGSPVADGNLVVDESKLEDRKRNSAKRRRSDEVSDLDSDMDDALSEASWNSEDDPDRLWCICRKPHNNRFMICCDVCEEWFHGKCVGITKTIGKQMEQDGLEWSCPNCTKKKKLDENVKEAEKIKILKEKMAQSIRDQQQKIRESQKGKAGAQGSAGKGIKTSKGDHTDLKQTKISDYSRQLSEDEPVGRKCIMCKGPVRENSIYCSDDCIRKHSQHAISQLMGDSGKKSKSESPGSSNQSDPRLQQGGRKEESRIIVMDASSKKVLVGQQAPTAANLATWLKENPSYHVVYKKSDKSGKFIVTSPKFVKIQSKATPGESSQKLIQLPSGQRVSVQQSDIVKSTQLKLAVSPNSKQVKVLQTPIGNQGKKQIYQIVNSSPGSSGVKSTFIVRQKQPEVIDALPLVSAKSTPGKGVAGRGKLQEASSPKQPTKEIVTPKGEKMQRKRKERAGARGSAASVTAKELKQTQIVLKSDDGKDKEKEKRDNDQQIRESVKKTLAETLKSRVQECKDMEFSDEHIDGLALAIEDKLYRHFENKTDTKYKSKYRSLVFNIKDPKNETLFRKILDNSISPKELVKLSPEELASQELARWREKENQHQLEIIKKTELELMTIGNTYIMKSHKGEQVIENDASEKVAAVAAEIDPNTPAQELVSALNSVSSTTQDANEEDEKNKGESETTLMKMKNKEKEHRSSKERDRKRTKRDRERRRSRSRSRSRSSRHRSKEKKRSRSRERDRSRHRHRERKSERKRERDSKDRSGSPDDKSEHKFDKSEITTSEEVEERTAKKHRLESFDDADHEPSSTVNIKTPDINVESEPVYMWKGTIVMADVAKFNGVATEVSGDCSTLSMDIGDKVDVVGRIPFDTVWDYIARMKKMATKDILVIKLSPGTEDEKTSYTTLYTYLSKRSRIGVIGKTSEVVKDFYLYPLASHSPLPPVLLSLEGFALDDERDNILLGIIVRSKHKSQRSMSIESNPTHVPSKTSAKLTSIEEKDEGEKSQDRSYTPPLPDKELEDKLSKKDPRLKKKIRVHVDYSKPPVEEDDDSPYSPGDSDEDLPPLPKIQKLPANVSKLLSPVAKGQEGLQDPVEIQRKIEEMNRAIEEQTQQIQNLSSVVPKLATTIPLPTLPLLASSILSTPSTTTAQTATLPQSSPLTATLPLLGPNKASSDSVELPMLSTDQDERQGSPGRSFTPPIKIEENIPFLPEVTSKISLPSNLQEILNSIQKKTGSDGGESKGIEDLVKSNAPDIDTALNVFSQTKNLLNSLSTLPSKEPSGDKTEESSPAILSRLSDEDIIRKAKEMEMEMEAQAQAQAQAQQTQQLKQGEMSQGPLPEMYPQAGGVPIPPPQPLPPGVQDIPMMTPAGGFGFNLPPNVLYPPPMVPGQEIMRPPTEEKCLTDMDERKGGKKSKLDPKTVFENEGVPNFMSSSGSTWDDKKQKKPKNYKIDIKLAMNTLEKKKGDFDVEGGSDGGYMDERGFQHKSVDEGKYDVDERILPPKIDDKHHHGGLLGPGPAGPAPGIPPPSGNDGGRRRRSDDWEGKRDWKYDGRRHWDDNRRYNKADYRRHSGRRYGGPGGGGMGGQGPGPNKFGRKDRFDEKRDRHLEKEWEGSIKDFEERQRRKNQEIRREEHRRLRKRSDSSSN